MDLRVYFNTHTALRELGENVCLQSCLQFHFNDIEWTTLVSTRIKGKDLQKQGENIYFQALANTCQNSHLLETGFQGCFPVSVKKYLLYS